MNCKEERGYINKDKILQYVSQEEIFELVFDFKPKESDYITSPFREDKTPGCWFSYNEDGKLKFMDFANHSINKGIKMVSIDCFDAVQIYFNLDNFYKTLEFIKDNLIEGRNLKKRKRKKIEKARKKKKVKINIKIKSFTVKDKYYWKRYGITSQNLIDDKVFSVNKFQLLNTKKGDIYKYTNTLCYAYTDFQEERKKLYFPNKKGKYRFISNCSSNDIGEIKRLKIKGKLLVISKSYKDCRVLRNENLNSIWFQNEGMIPDERILKDLCQRYSNIIVFFDNDKAGIEASIKIKNVINNIHYNKAKNLYLPEKLNLEGISDPSDLYEKKGEKELKSFLKNNTKCMIQKA